MAAAAVALSTGVVPAKIVMKGTSRLSLNERFTELSKKVVIEEQKVTRLGLGFNNNVNSLSVVNKRLAYEMESRPAVRAALSLKNKSVKQRLGAKARLGFNSFNSNMNGRLSNGFTPRFAGGGGLGAPRFNYGSPRGFSGRRGFFGFRRRRYIPGLFNSIPRRYGFGGGFRRGRGGRRGFGGFRPARLRSLGGSGQQPRLSREELDRELDTYMAKTKSQLDTELDTYMADS